MGSAVTIGEAVADPPPGDTDEPPAREAVAFDAVYDAHADFVWRCLRRLGVGGQEALGAVVGDVDELGAERAERYDEKDPGEDDQPPVTGGNNASSRASPISTSSDTKRWSSAARRRVRSAKAAA